MSMMEAISLRGREVKNGVLNLGYENGWGENTYNLYKDMNHYRDDSTYKHGGPAHSQWFSVMLRDGDVKIEMRWQLDSGD